MKLCIEGDIYFIPKFHILETGTVKLSIDTGLGARAPNDHFPDSSLVWVLRTPSSSSRLSFSFFIIFARYSMPTIFSFAISSMAAMYLGLLFLSTIHIQIHTHLKWGGYG
jgi:hypothetical protein